MPTKTARSRKHGLLQSYFKELTRQEQVGLLTHEEVQRLVYDRYVEEWPKELGTPIFRRGCLSIGLRMIEEGAATAEDVSLHINLMAMLCQEHHKRSKETRQVATPRSP